MPGLFSRIKNWISLENLTNEDLNDEFNNVISNFIPSKVDDYSSSVAQMKIQTTPGAQGSESQATSLAGEIERLRYVISRIIGETYWYDAPNIDLANAASIVNASFPFPQNRIISGRVNSNDQPIFLTPSGSTTTATLKATSTPFVAIINGTQYTISSDVTITGLQVAGDPTLAGNQVVVNDPGLTGAAGKILQGRVATENGYALSIDTVGANWATLDGRVVGLRLDTATFEYALAYYKASTAELYSGYRNFFFDSSDAQGTPKTLADNMVVSIMKLGWIFLKTDSTLAVTYTPPRWSGTQPASPSIGDYWFDVINDTWKVYSGTSWDSAAAILIGVVLMDGTKCVAARSLDFFYPYQGDGAQAKVRRISDTEIRLDVPNYRVNVRGKTFFFGTDVLRWNTGTDMASGVSLTNSTDYFLYVTHNGDPKISDVPPINRKDLLGYYHRFAPWRCVGYVFRGVAVFNAYAVLPIEHALSTMQQQEADEIYLRTGNGFGGTNTKIRRFSSVTIKNQSNNTFTYADSAALGGSITINKAGLYIFNYTDYNSAAGATHGITVNTAQPTTNIYSLSDLTEIISITSSGTNIASAAAGAAYLRKGDVIRAHSDGSQNSTDAWQGLKVTRANDVFSGYL